LRDAVCEEAYLPAPTVFRDRGRRTHWYRNFVRPVLCSPSSCSPPRLASAQGVTITGLVTSDAGTPLASASVILDGMSIGTITRDDGRYTLVVPAARAPRKRAERRK